MIDIPPLIPLLVSGMLWSGSSAVVDALSECRSLATLSGEFKFFSHWVAPRYSVLSLLRDEIGESEAYFQVAYDLMSLRMCVTRLPGGFHRRKLRRIRRLLSICTLPLLRFPAARRLINWLGDRTAIGSAELLSGHLAQFVAPRLRHSARWHRFTLEAFWTAAADAAAALLAHVSAGRRFIICDQAVPILARDPPHETPDGLAFYRNSVQLAVYRDPADQLADFIVKGGPEQWKRIFASRVAGYEGDEIQRFCAWQIDSLRRLQDLAMRNAGRVIPIGFEEFVTEYPAWRTRLASHLGLEFPKGVSGRFDPARSARNIGIHKDVLTAEQRAAIGHVRSQFEEVWHDLGATSW
jgi:hypothetical protein